MPFCTRCGQEAGATDAFCGHCGAPQTDGGIPDNAGDAPPPPPRPPFTSHADPLGGLSPRSATILCYVPAIGWIAAILVLATRRFKDNHIIRFHAFQGLYLFAAWLVVDWVVGPIVRTVPGHYFPLDMVLHGLILAVSIFMMVKASHDEAYVLPIIGELAQRSATEQ
jgi:uncharacterized membrane protein